MLNHDFTASAADSSGKQRTTPQYARMLAPQRQGLICPLLRSCVS
jgi:hypothetical protein